ncbi:MAG: efflux RND transporter periplasmic adaptor subunit [Myxococcota bacterium]
MRAHGAALVAVLLLACESADSPPPVSAKAPALRMHSVEVSRVPIVDTILGTGTLAAEKTTEIGPRVDGIIEEILVKVGDRVDAGAPLFRTRDTDYRIRLRDAEYSLRLARARAEQTARELERVEGLHEGGVASDQRLDEVRTAHRIAVAERGRAEAALDRARQELEDTFVRAPYPGVITRRYVDEGMMMRTMMSRGTAVVQLMKTDVIVAIVQVPAIHLPRIHVGTPVRLHVDGVVSEYESTVRVVNDRVDPTTRAVEVRIAVPNPELELKPGLFVRAELIPEPRAAVVVDRIAVLGTSGARYVFVAREGRAVRRPVRTRDLDARRVEVLEGLAPGQRVLTGPELARLEDGTPVRLEHDDVAL